MVIHKCGQHGRRCTALYWRRLAKSARKTACVGCLVRSPIRHPRLIVGCRSGLERPCPKLTVFRASANRSAAFLCGSLRSAIGRRVRGWQVWREWIGWGLRVRHRSKFDPRMARQYPRTVARTSAIRQRSGHYRAGTAPASQTPSLTGLSEGLQRDYRVRPA